MPLHSPVIIQDARPNVVDALLLLNFNVGAMSKLHSLLPIKTANTSSLEE